MTANLRGRALVRDRRRLDAGGSAAGPSRRAMPSAMLIVNLGAPLRIRAGTDIETAEYADGYGCVVTMPTRVLGFGDPLRTRSVGVHFKPWGWRRSCRCPRPSCVTGR